MSSLTVAQFKAALNQAQEDWVVRIIDIDTGADQLCRIGINHCEEHIELVILGPKAHTERRPEDE